MPHFVPAGLLSTGGAQQTVANAGRLRGYPSTEEVHRTRALRDEVQVHTRRAARTPCRHARASASDGNRPAAHAQAIEGEIAELERALFAVPAPARRASVPLPPPPTTRSTTISDLMARLQKLQAEALLCEEEEAAEPPPPPLRNSGVAPARLQSARTAARPGTAGSRPSSAPYNVVLEGEGSESVASWSDDAFGRSRNPGWYHLHRKEVYAERARINRESPKGCFISHAKYADEAVRIANTGRLAF